MKKCTKCGVEKRFEDFYKNKNYKDGLRYWCKSCVRFYNGVYCKNNIEERCNYSRVYNFNNKDIRNSRRRERRKTDPLFKMREALRNRTIRAFKRKSWYKDGSEKMLGANWGIVHKHIESTFMKDMNWGNHGEWHIDHIIPLDSANTKKELIKLCHYTNLQALWAVDNIRKGNNYKKEDFIKYIETFYEIT